MTETLPAPVQGAGWLRALLSGADNETPAIGRVLGVVLFINLLLILPAVVAAALWGRRVEPRVWFEFLSALGGYVPLAGATVAGIIGGTAFTEPHPRAAG